MLRLGYNTSGFAHLQNMMDVVGIIRSIGYAGLELTLDRRHFHPHFSSTRQLRQLARSLSGHSLGIVLNTGGRYVLSNVAHEPSLVSASPDERRRFIEFVGEVIRLAPDVGSRVVMLHSGALPPGIDSAAAWGWLVEGTVRLADIAATESIVLGFEFHPSMFVATLEDYRRLKAFVRSEMLKLTLDVGHSVCTDARPVSEVIAECNGDIVNVHLEDIQSRKHEHLPIGQGDIDFGDVFRGLTAVGYEGLINVEFNTDDLEVDECQLARETFKHLQPLL